MRKTLISMLLCLSLLLGVAALAETAEPDVDLTELDSLTAINTVYELADAPEENQGKTVRLKGYIAYSSWEGKETYLLLSEGASCCAEQLAFVPAESPDDPEALGTSMDKATIQGVLDISVVYGIAQVKLVDVLIDAPAA